MYDWANSAFVTTIMAAILPVYYYQVAATPLPEMPERKIAWQERCRARKLTASNAAPTARLTANRGESSIQETATAPAESPRFSPWTLSMSSLSLTARSAARCRPLAPRRPAPGGG